MIDLHTLSSLSLPILFMKATVKKQVFVPTFTRADGRVVLGHYAMVHVSTDHDDAKVLAGGGSHSQKLAHAKLSKQEWFHALPAEHKVPVLLNHATKIQDKASAAAVLSTLKKKALAGLPPTNAEWKAYASAPESKMIEIIDAVEAAGKKPEFLASHEKYLSATAPDQLAPIAPASSVDAAIDKKKVAHAKAMASTAAAAKMAEESNASTSAIPVAAPNVAAPAPKVADLAAVVPATSAYKIVNKPNDGSEGAIWSLSADPVKVAGALGLFPNALDGSNETGYSSTHFIEGPGGHVYAVYGANGSISVRPLQVGSKKVPDDAATAFANQLASDAGGNATVPQHLSMPQSLGGAALAAAASTNALLSKIEAAKLPETNTNHKPVNQKLAAIHAALKAGDIKSLLMHGHGSNTYAHKAVKLANEALALLGSLHAVVAGQKMGTHAGLSGSAPAPKPEPSKPSKVVGATVKQPVTAAPDSGPKNGDTKPGADGSTLVFKDGRWHMQGVAPSDGEWDFNPSDQGFSGCPTIGARMDDGGYCIVVNGDGDGFETMHLDIDGSPLDNAHFESLDEALKFAERLGAPAFPDSVLTKLDPSYKPKLPAAAPVSLKGMLFHNTEPGHSKFWQVALNGDQLVTKNGKIGTKGVTHVKKFDSPELAQQAHNALIAQKIKGKYKLHGAVDMSTGATVAPAPSKPSKVVGATVTPPAAAPHTPANKPVIANQNDAMYQSASSPLAMDGWKKIGEQQGHNEGGTYVDESGQKWYCKFPAGGEKVARNELLATRLYALAGVSTTSMRLISQGGKVGVASKIIEGAKTDKAALLSGKADGLLSGFAVDAWLANWDTVGNNPAAGKGFDNILIDGKGAAVRIDAGGALMYGGAGGKKQEFSESVIELKTMLDPKKNPNTAAVFGKMSQGDIAASVAKVAAIPDAEIIDYCQKFGPGSEAERSKLADKLIARKADMLSQYPLAGKKSAAKVVKKKPDPTKLKVDASNLPPIHDFMSWNGTGKPISDKPYVLKNIHDENALKDFALQGNLIALKEYKFAQVDKVTGEPTGVMLPIEQHPSNHIKAYHSDLVAALTSIAYPPEAPRSFVSKIADGIVDLSKKFPTKALGSTVANVAANERLAFWMAIGVAKNVDDFRPKHTPLISDKAKAAAHAAYKTLGAGSLAKRFINRIQSSGSYNDYFRDGKTMDSEGIDLIAMNKAVHEFATEQPAGMTIHKWISMSSAQVQALVASPEGTVFENAGSMCCSTSPTGTSGFGQHRMVIRYAPGAKGVDSFGSGRFGSEAEITTLPGARYMILSSKMVHCPVKGGQRLELEVLMLPPDPTYLASLSK